MKFNEKTFRKSRVVPRGQTDRQDEANSRSLNFANAPEKENVRL